MDKQNRDAVAAPMYDLVRLTTVYTCYVDTRDDCDGVGLSKDS